MEDNRFIIKGWNGSEDISDIKSIIDSLNRFINLGAEQGKEITLIPLFKLELYEQDDVWNKFLKELDSRLKKDETGQDAQNIINFSTAILFYTPEEIPRGDFPDSVYNESRMLRNFFENTSYARTANYRNIVEKLKELIVEIKENKKKNLSESIEDLEKLTESQSLKELSKIYTYQSFHTGESHGELRKFADSLEAPDLTQNVLESFKNKYYLVRQRHDIASIISNNPLRFEPLIRFEPLKILVIDDNAEQIKRDFKKIEKFLPKNTEVWVTEGKEYKKFLYDKNFIRNLYNGNDCAKLNLSNLSNNEKELSFSEIGLFEKNKFINKFIFGYVIVDLLLGKYNEGNKIIRELVKFRHIFDNKEINGEKCVAKFHILVYSLSDDVEDIYRAFEEGTLGYVWKFGRIYSLPALIGELEESRQQLIKGIASSAVARGKARNFSKLYHLLPKLQLKLNTEPFLPCVEKNGEFDKLAKDVARNWIWNLPKADLHYHLGGSMDDNIIFYLSVNSLAYIVEKIEENKSYIVEKNEEKENELKVLIDKIKGKLEGEEKNQDFYEQIFGSFYEKISKNLNKEEYQSWLNTISVEEEKRRQYIEKYKNKPAELYFDYLTYDINKGSKIKFSKDELITIFIVCVGIKEGRTIEEAKMFWEKLKNNIEELKKRLNNNKKETENKKSEKSSLGDLINFINDRYNKFKPKILDIDIDTKIKNLFQNNQKSQNSQKKESSQLLRSLIQAPKDTKSLSQLFRGDCFFGALHLQYYENIVACIWYTAEKAAEENIRYLEVRVAPSGYTHCGLKLQEAIQALFDGADLSSLYLYLLQGKFIWINFITSLKRHKTPFERAQEIASAVVYREREIERLKKEMDICLPGVLYRWQPSKIVGVDLSGYEKQFPAVQFVEDFAPIFKVCSFITIHAGEEETAQSIWEAVYKLHANRIGHGLTLVEFPSLMELARDLQICIELCPTSNELTGYSGQRRSQYPLYSYIKEGLNITINTDDKAVINTTLSDEYVKAAEFFYFSEENTKKLPLTKWEVLRIVKAGFDNAFINREEKRELLKCVEEEVYQKILQYYEIEPVYLVDKTEGFL